MDKLEKGMRLKPLIMTDINNQSVSIPDPFFKVHLQFRRFAGCPICDVHMGRMAARHHELVAHGVKEVIVFYSDDKTIRNHLSDIPFTLISDSKKHFYQQFGVEASVMSIVHPAAWVAAFQGVLNKLRNRQWFIPNAEESMLGLPADFLIDTDGTLLDVSYGRHAYDQWDYETVLDKAIARR